MEYVKPLTIQEAVSALVEFGDGAKLVAGGQSLLAIMKQGILEPDALVSLSGIDELKAVRKAEDGSLVIGAMATHDKVMRDPLVREQAPLLADTARRVASTQIRNMGTWGGNLSHGEPGADPPAALIAVGASVEIAGPDGSRTIPVEDLFVDYLTTDLNHGEILSKIIVPVQPANSGAAYIKHTVRDDGDLAIVGIGVRVTMDEAKQKIAEARIGINGASLTTIRALSAEALLQGKTPDDELFAQAGVLAAEACDPLDDAEASAEYRVEMVKVLVKRALKQALAAAK
ncbi:FAD binding domain-containing protein [Ferviditalea candida]|uniref:Xanthine dehydrogenase family protein subunit M n=1 Tax=Ferviditalea candida TaxID=3108399 RepID=A0ABU5ZM45_9BACL|nr:xanthine dehydrogenase family protein subunit M [Paenibacillaceae bacterium T2]